MSTDNNSHKQDDSNVSTNTLSSSTNPSSSYKDNTNSEQVNHNNNNLDKKLSVKNIQSQNSRSRSNSDLNSKNTLPLPATSSLRAKLSRNPSSNSVSESTKTKMKLKLQLSQQAPANSLSGLHVAPVLLSPRSTPGLSPNYHDGEFFANYDSVPNTTNNTGINQSQLDNILDQSIRESITTPTKTLLLSPLDQVNVRAKARSPPERRSSDEYFSAVDKSRENSLPSISPLASQMHSQFENAQTSGTISQSKTGVPDNKSLSTASITSAQMSHSKSNLHPLQTKLNRLPAISTTNVTNSNKPPRSPLHKYKSRNIAYQPLPEPVRPQSSILKSNINTKFSQQYQQQEKKYLTGITKYRNRYQNADDYYDKSISPDDVETASEPTTIPSNDSAEFNKLSSVDSEIFTNEEDAGYINDQNSKDREYEALKALGQQIGSDLLNEEFETISEYSIDSNALLELLNRNDEIQLKDTTANGIISERLEWQAMLRTVLTGDVVTGEKTKLVKPLAELEGENILHVGFKEDFWLGIRAKLYGRTEEEQRRLVLYHRGLVDETFDEIMKFKLEFPADCVNLSYSDKVKFASKKVNHLLDKYERCQELWRTQKEMETDKPQCATPEFISRIDCLVAWTSVTDAVATESAVLKKWVGNDDLDILRSSANSHSDADSLLDNEDSIENSTTATKTKGDSQIFKDDRPFVERILKEKDIENLFNKRLFTTFSHWTIKAKTSYLKYHKYFNELGLPSYLDNLFVLTNFPSKLMKEIIKTRLAYAKKLKNPTMMMIDQTLDDFKTYLRLALEIRISMLEYCAPVDGWISFPDYQDPEFDDSIIQCINHYLNLLNRKLLFSPKGLKSFRTFKEPEELEKEWEFFQNVGFYIEDIAVDFSSQICALFLKLLNRFYSFIQQQIQGPPNDGHRLDSQRLIRWYTSSMENFGQMRRKFIRFELNLFQYFHNSISFKVLPQKTQKFFNLLKESNHSLYHNPKIAEDGVYIFVSESLVNRPYDVKCILKNTHLGVNFANIPKRHLDVIQSYHPTSSYGPFNSDFEDDEESNNVSLDYVIVIVPPKALMWDGSVVQFNDIDSLEIGDLARGNAMFLTSGGPAFNISESFDIFKQYTLDTIGRNTKLCCSVPQLEEDFQISIKLFSRITCFTIDSTPSIRNLCRGVGGCQELVNNIFMFSRDVGRDSIRNKALTLDLSFARGTVILRLIKLAIEWLSFIVDDCSPTDPKTFRWCVSALEFAMDVTRGFNILTLDSEKFYRLRDKVAGCMTLLIAHFDIMGARAKELQKTRMENYALKSQKDIYTLDDESLGSLRQHIMLQVGKIEEERRQLQVEQRSVGRVLDDKDMENQLLTYLASSFSSVSIRWQKGKFLGGGTFGSVFAGVNLDTGGPMAVKEITFQDRQSIKTIVPAIKGEMSVLELLSHPNIVQFFGVEVHRDRVYIFMEYCSGGSLAGLLEYGRIEDEFVIQLYTLQMLEGLAYLHQFGIVHRDVKPDNILLDHMGVIKFVDFGSAKVIAIPNGSTSAHSSGTALNNSNTPPNANGSFESDSGNVSNGSVNESTANVPPNNSSVSVNENEIHAAADYVKSNTSTVSSTLSLNEAIGQANHGAKLTSTNSNLMSTLSSLSTSSISAYTGYNGGNTSGGGGASTYDNITTNNSTNTSRRYSRATLNDAIAESFMESKKSHALTGTPMYMSPETIKGDSMGKFGSMDIWSLGCCVLEMATGRRPWSNLDNEFAVMYHIAAGHLPQFPSNKELSELGQEFLAKCLTIDPTKRASAVELLQDPWIQAIRDEAFSDSNGLNVNEISNCD